MKKNIIVLVISGLVFLSSCTFGPDFQKEEWETPEKFTNDSLHVDTLVNIKWWDLFDDPVLDSLVVLALEKNKNVQIAAAKIEEARAALGFTSANMYPKLDLQAGAARGNYASGSKLATEVNNFYVAPTLSWEIDFWGKLRRATESAKASYLASEFGYRTIQISLIGEVVSTYFSLLDYKQRLKIALSTLESREYSLHIIEQRFDKGVIPEIDLNQAQIQKEIALVAIPTYERLVKKTENALNILIGSMPKEIETGRVLHEQTIPPMVPAGLPADLLTRRPDIIQAEYQVQAQNAQIGVAEAMRMPAISLTGILGLASNDLSTLTDDGAAWSISGSLFGPLFNFNKNTRRVEVEEAKTKQALLNYESVVLNAFREVEDALIEVRTYKLQTEAKERQFLAANNAAKLSNQRYDQGVTSYLEVLETERSAFQAELELSQTTQEYLLAYVKLYKALGGGWISEKEMHEAENLPAE